VRQTGADTDDFARRAKIVQIDIDAAQLNNRIQADIAILADAETFFRSFEVEPGTFAATSPDWLARLASLRECYAKNEYADWDISPSVVFALLNKHMSGAAVDYVCDVGNHQMWAAQGLRLGEHQAVHYSGGMGAMGFALPAALGIASVSPHKTIVITGDGSLQVNSQELDTLHRLQSDLAVIVMNNHSLGMVKNFQDMYFNGRNQSTRQGYSCPSFTDLAGAYGIRAIHVARGAELERAVVEIAESRGPILIEIAMPYATECRPRLAFGKKLDEQYPPVV
jgi:acetolactate synthase-1/2/3 large subunit